MDKYKAESILPYNKKESKSSQVRQMFDTIAPTYDMLNRMMTFGIDKQWRRAAMKRLAAYRPKTILDIATGTGDLPLLMEKMFSPESITGIDLSEGMLNIARKKIDEYHLNDKIKFFCEDCLSLSFADNTFDAITVSFGVRNFEHLEKGYSEMYLGIETRRYIGSDRIFDPRTFSIQTTLPIIYIPYYPINGKTVYQRQPSLYVPTPIDRCRSARRRNAENIS